VARHLPGQLQGFGGFERLRLSDYLRELMERLHRLVPLVLPRPLLAPAHASSTISWDNLERDSIAGLSKAFLIVR